MGILTAVSAVLSASLMKRAALKRNKSSKPVAILRGSIIFRPGNGFGIRQPVVSMGIMLTIPRKIDLAALDQAMREFLPGEQASFSPSNSDAEDLVVRIIAWQAAIQRNASIPVFGNGTATRVSDSEWALTMPYFSARATEAVMAWTLAAVEQWLLPGSQQVQFSEHLRQLYATLCADLRNHALPGTDAYHFVEAAYARKIDFNPIGGVIGFGLGCNSTWLDGTITGATSAIAMKIARNKYACARVLDIHGLPTPVHRIVADADQAVSIAQQISYPVVVKPFDRDGGVGVFAGLSHEGAVREAFTRALSVSRNLLVERHVAGADFRLTVLHGKVIKVMQRRPGGVTGDGIRTITELLEEEQRKPDHQAALWRTGHMRISLDDEAMGLLQEFGFASDSIPASGHFVVLRRKSNVSTGGTHCVVPMERVHHDNLILAVNAASVVGLDIAGIDLLTTDIARSWRETGGVICEVNGQPQIGYRDTPEIYDHILSKLLKNQGQLHVHLFVAQAPYNPPAAFLKDVKSKGCNAIVMGREASIAEVGAIGPFRNSFYAAKAVLADRRTTGAILCMAWQDILSQGLPAGWFTSIRVMPPSGCPLDTIHTVKQMVAAHSNEVVFLSPAPDLTPQPQTSASAAQ